MFRAPQEPVLKVAREHLVLLALTDALTSHVKATYFLIHLYYPNMEGLSWVLILKLEFCPDFERIT